MAALISLFASKFFMTKTQQAISGIRAANYQLPNGMVFKLYLAERPIALGRLR